MDTLRVALCFADKRSPTLGFDGGFGFLDSLVFKTFTIACDSAALRVAFGVGVASLFQILFLVRLTV